MATPLLKFKVGKKIYKLPVTYRAWLEVADRVADPLQVQMKVAAGDEPFRPSIGQVITLLHIGVSAGDDGFDMTEEDFGDLLFEKGSGIGDYVLIALQYFMAFVEFSQPEKPVPTADADTDKKKSIKD